MSGAAGKWNIDAATLAKHSISVPRYTSYPTVPEWSTGLDANTVAGNLDAAGDAARRLSLYVHIPFCMRLCLYCGCNIVITQNRSRAADYLDLVEKEMDAVAARRIAKNDVVQVHWGGGTPTYLNEGELSRLYDMMRSRFRFAEDAEIGIEVDPRETPPEKAKHLARLGFNRLSMGLQDFDPEVQRAVQRIQPYDMTKATLDAAREAGIDGINIDLMYGLPLQTRARFEKTLEQVLQLRPDRLALFHYAHLPQMIRHQKAIKEAQLPTSSEKFEIFCAAAERLTAAGYEFIGLDHFALPEDELATARRNGTLNRNFQGYTTSKGSDLVGFGVSAISNVGRIYSQNLKDLPAYGDAVKKGGFAPWRGFMMSDDDVLRRDVIYRLMCHGRLEKSAVAREHGIDFDRTFAVELEELDADVRDGLLEVEGDVLRLTPLGVVLMRNVARRFDAHLRRKVGGASNFSRSV